jgi:hypothetical protein
LLLPVPNSSLISAKRYLLPLVFLWFIPSFFPAQEISNSLNSLHSVFNHLQSKYNVILSYDVELTKNVPVNIDTSGTDLRKIIQQLDAKSGFNFDIINNKNVIVRPKSAAMNFLLQGIVTDKKTKEPLLGAMVYQSHAKYGTFAGEDGSFYKVINYSPNDSVVVFCMGYEKTTYPLSYFASGSRIIYLESQRIQMNEVSVTAYLTTGVSYDNSDNSINIRPKNLSLLPGNTNGDLLSSLDALPGISTPDGKAGNLNIRGSSPDQTQINVDEIPIYLKGHYFGTISPINPNAVNNIKVQRSTMSVNKGGRAGGLIDIHTPNSVVNKFQGTLAASALDANLHVHTPLLKDKLSLSVSGRYSYPYNVNNPALEPISDFVFQRSEIRALLDGVTNEKLQKLGFDYMDANAKLNYNLSKKHKGSLSYLYIQNDMLVERNSQQNNTSQGDKVKLSNWGLNSSLHSSWAPRFNTFLSLTHSFYNQTFSSRQTNFKLDSLISRSTYENVASDSRILFETDWKFARNFVLKTGYDGRIQDLSYLRKTENLINSSFQQNFRNIGTVHTGYTTLSGTLSKRLFFNVGLRANYYTVTQDYSFEPRGFLNFAINDFFRLKASGGYQKQFVTQITGVGIESIGGLDNQLWMLADDKVIPVINSTQGTFGGMFEKNSWLVDLEGYYRELSNISSISITTPLRDRPFIHGNIETKGLDLLVRKQWKALDAWVSYSLSESWMKFDSINNGHRFYSLYDQTHVLDLACSYRIGQWKLSLSWKYRTGLAALPSIRTRMLSGAPTVQKTPPPPPPPGSSPPPEPAVGYTDRFPDYHQLDAAVYYEFPKEVKKYKGSVGLSLINCYNQTNIIEQSSEGKEIKSRTMPGFSPNLFLSISFN